MTHRAHRIGMGTVRCSAGEMLVILRPGERGGSVIVTQHVIRLWRARDAPAARVPRLLFAPLDLASPIGVGPGIERVSQERVQGRALGTSPLQGPCGRSLAPAHTPLDALLHEITHQGVPRAECGTRPNKQAHHLWHVRIGLTGHRTCMVPDRAHRQGNAQLTPAGLLECPLPHALCEQMSRRLTHGALQSQPYPIMIVPRVIETVHVRAHGATQRTGLESWMPVRGGACHTRHLHAPPYADMLQTHFRHQALTPLAVLCHRARLTPVFLDDPYAGFRPTQGHGSLHQTVWHPCRRLLMQDLRQGGLPDRDDGQAIQLPGHACVRLALPRLRDWVQRHACPPRACPSRSVGAPATACVAT